MLRFMLYITSYFSTTLGLLILYITLSGVQSSVRINSLQLHYIDEFV